jgi:hypothetical protein
MDYANFDLRLAGSTGACTAEVLDAPAGQTTGPQAAVCSLPAIPDSATASIPDLEASGRALWGCAFPGQVAELWRASLAAASDAGLRLRLTVEAPDPSAALRQAQGGSSGPGLAAQAWELLYDPTAERFLALDAGTPVIRYVRLPFAAEPWPRGRSLRLLCTAASPVGLPPLDVGAEAEALVQALAEPIKAGRLTHEALPGDVTLAGLLAAVRRGVDIWHFSGHGGQEGLVFADAQGSAEIVAADRLGLLLAGEGVRLAVLNACRAGQGGGQAASVAGALVRAGVPAVVTMQGDVPDEAARAFAGGFYAALAAGQPVDRAATSGRKVILALGGYLGASWWLPTLFLRAPDGVLWREEREMADARLQTGKTVQGDEIHTSGPAATRGGVVNTGSGVAFAGDGNVVITGKVGGDVVIGSSRPSAGGTDRAGFLRLLAAIRRAVAGLGGQDLAPDDRADALAALDKVSEQAGRAQPPGDRIVSGLASVQEILDEASPAASRLAAQVDRARQAAQGLFR